MWLQQFLIILSIIYGSYGSQSKYGYSIPLRDVDLEYGKDEINVTCIITNEALKAERMRDPDSLNFTFCMGKDYVPESQIIRLNATAIRYVNKTPKMMVAFLNCIYNNISITLNSIVVGTKPNNVTDFDCIGYNLENLTCSWTADTKAQYKVKYKLTYYYNNKTPRTTECGEYTIKDFVHSCVFTATKQPYYRPSHDIIYFILDGSNKLGTNLQTFEIQHYKKIKTSPPANLRVENSTVSSLFLSWDIPDNMVKTHVSLEHNITYTFNSSNFRMGKLFSTSCESKRVYANLTDLPFAYVLYNVRVYMRLNGTNATDMWSEKEFVIHLTNGTLPGAPIANRRAFYYDGSSVVIYWSQVDALYKNGANFTYIVHYESGNVNWNRTTTQGFFELNNLSITQEHVFKIRSKNHVGTSLNYSEIVVPPLYNPEMEMDFPVLKEYSDTKYGLSWSPPTKGAEHLQDYTVYWCESSTRSQFHLCSNIKWATVPQNVTSHIIPVSSTDNIEMAISANSKRESTSMKWPDCLVRHDKLSHKPSIEIVSRMQTATSITISWKVRCLEESKKIKNFVIEYCELELQTNCRGPKKEEKISMNTTKLVTSYTIKNLESYTTYMINVYMQDFNQSSSHGKVEYVTTLEGRPHRPTNLNITKVTNTSITFEWSLPKKHISKVIREMKVKYNNLFKNVTQAIQTGIPDSIPPQNITLTDLLSYETYNISISACIDQCSEYSDVVSATTKVGRPSRIDKISYYSLNNSITWEKPIQPGGNISYYELIVRLDDKPLPLQVIHTTMHILNKCSDNSDYRTVSYKVRAVNLGENGETYEGDWSKEQTQRCQTVQGYTVEIAIGFALLIVVMMAILLAIVFGKKCYVYIVSMKDVQFQLPDGLYENKDRFPRGNELDFIKEPQGDDQFLLYDKDGIKRSGDSSGCSSGQDSAESDSGTSLGSSSDSGTEQPRTKDDDRLVEAVPLEDFSLSTSGNGPTTYCQLGYPSSHSDSKELTPFSFPKVDIPLIVPNESTSGSDISPYIRCEQMESRPINPGYVANPIPTSGYVPHTVEEKKSGYVPHPSVEKNTGYVMAAEKNSLISPSNENKGYVQVADVSNSQMLNNENLPRTNGYVSYGDVKSLPASPEMRATSAYVPHKQLDEVLNK